MNPISGTTLNEAPGTLDARLIETLGPDTAKAVIEEFRMGWEMDKVMAAKRQVQIAQEVQAVERCTLDGLGQHRASIDLTAFLHWHIQFNGQCWKDASFMNEFLRDNPAVRTRYRPRTLALSVQGLKQNRPAPQPLTPGGTLVAA